MWYHPAALILGGRDVIGAWLVCLAITAACARLSGGHRRPLRRRCFGGIDRARCDRYGASGRRTEPSSIQWA